MDQASTFYLNQPNYTINHKNSKIVKVLCIFYIFNK